MTSSAPKQETPLPCPCCGFAAGVKQVPLKARDPNAGGYYIECTNKMCGLTTQLRFACGDNPVPLLIETWNTRALSASRQGEEPTTYNYPWLIERTVNGQIQYLSQFSAPWYEPVFTTDPWQAMQHTNKEGAEGMVAQINIFPKWKEIVEMLKVVNHCFEYPYKPLASRSSAPAEGEKK